MTGFGLFNDDLVERAGRARQVTTLYGDGDAHAILCAAAAAQERIQRLECVGRFDGGEIPELASVNTEDGRGLRGCELGGAQHRAVATHAHHYHQTEASESLDDIRCGSGRAVDRRFREPSGIGLDHHDPMSPISRPLDHLVSDRHGELTLVVDDQADRCRRVGFRDRWDERGPAIGSINNFH